MKAFTKISLAMASGLMMAAAWPTRGFTPLIFIAFIPLLYLQDISGDPDNKKKATFFYYRFLPFYMEHSDYILGMEQHCCRCNSHVDTEQHFYGNSILGLSLCQEKTLWKQKRILHVTRILRCLRISSFKLAVELAMAQHQQCLLASTYVDTMVRIHRFGRRHYLGIGFQHYHLQII